VRKRCGGGAEAVRRRCGGGAARKRYGGGAEAGGSGGEAARACTWNEFPFEKFHVSEPGVRTGQGRNTQDATIGLTLFVASFLSKLEALTFRGAGVEKPNV
jgi:hypothetical protein